MGETKREKLDDIGPLERKPKQWSEKQERIICGVCECLYDYKVLTLEQLMRMANIKMDANRLSIFLRESGYAKDSQQSVNRYFGGKWHRCNRLHLWHLTPWGVGQWEKYAFLSRWGYSSGELGVYRTQNPERVVQLADVHSSLMEVAGGCDLEFWSVPRMLNQLGAWHASQNEEDSELATLWRDRPVLAGAYSIRRNYDRFVLVGFYIKGLKGFAHYVKRAFPSTLLRGHGSCVFVGNSVYHEAFRQLQDYRINKGSLVLLSYEWAMDHPKWLMSILEGNRESVLSPYFEWVRSQGGAVERREGASLEWRVTHASGEVEYADTTVGNSVGRIYGIVTDKDVGISELGRFRRVLYVLNAAEKKFLEAVAEKALRSIEFRVLDWPGGK